jgi:hypothetical protein
MRWIRKLTVTPILSYLEYGVANVTFTPLDGITRVFKFPTWNAIARRAECELNVYGYIPVQVVGFVKSRKKKVLGAGPMINQTEQDPLTTDNVKRREGD